jgi:cytochrome c2
MSVVRWVMVCGVIGVTAVLFAACSSSGFDFAKGTSLTGGNPQVGKEKIVLHDCHSCHVIPGVEGDAHVLGPTLDHWSRRSSIISKWPNNPPNLENWIRHSEQLLPGTTMKMLSVNEQDAKDIAAYLFSIR